MTSNLLFKRKRTNEGLSPDKFKICVPKSCRLLGYDWQSQDRWEEYVRSLREDYELPSGYESETCYTYDFRPCWVLKGDLAVAHACKVHDRIHRQVLGFDQVSAIDVGFAIRETQTAFDDYLTIRIHVNRKRAPELLLRAGLPSFTLCLYAIPRRGSEFNFPTEGDLDRDACRRWRLLKDLVERELWHKKKIWKYLDRYPVSGVHWDDLSLYCPPRTTEPCTFDDIRLCICGVPLDIVNAQYSPSAPIHPGGDADSGVFVERPQQSNELSNEEQLLIGRGRVNPMVGGISVGSITGQAGSMGAVVWDRTDGTPCLLSNWHVLAGTTTSQVGQPTYQPALFDGGTEDDVVAYLKRWHLGEEGDVAIAELSGDRDYASGEMLGLWHPISGYMRPQLNMEVRKWGRTTGYTQGFVDGIHLATNIDYGRGVVRFFREQFHIAPLYEGEDVSQVGDSGSLVVTSFRPRDLETDLAKLSRWLLQCFDYRYEKPLCKEIDKTLKGLIRNCNRRKGCKKICKTLRRAHRELRAACCGRPDLQQLCRVIAKWHRKVEAKCQPIVKCAKFHDRVVSASERWYSECRTSRRNICSKVEPELEELICECDSLACKCCKPTRRLLVRFHRELRKACRGGIGRRRLCRLLDKWRRRLKRACRKTRRCAAICRRANTAFEYWYERCITQRVCELLQGACEKPGRKHPSDLVECIEEHLCTDLMPDAGENNGNKEELRNLLHALLQTSQHDPDVFLKQLKGTARRYYLRKKDVMARDVSRVYYAVGMIFAGDTPGSPFGEFAVASDIERLAELLRISLRPVFEPRSSFRELRVRPQPRSNVGGTLSSTRGLSPGVQAADPRGGGPQPDLEPGQSGPGTGGGG